jgi:hypothetical protein
MSDITFAIGNLQIITARVEPNKVQGRDLAGMPAIYIPLELQLLPAGKNGEMEYAVVRLAGAVQNQSLNEFASFDVGPLSLAPNATPYFRQQDVMIALDRLRAKRFEDARNGENANFQLTMSCLIWRPSQLAFEAARASGPLAVLVPKSQWAEGVASKWNLSHTRLIEIEFPANITGENFRTSFARIEEAEKLFLNGQYKQVLIALRLSFEGLAKGLGFVKVDKDFFDSLFASSPAEKREKAREAVLNLYKFLHLGPHEQGGDGTISRQDARFALTMAYAVFEYIVPKA